MALGDISGAPGGMPAWGSAPNYQANLQQDVASLAPLATTYHAPANVQAPTVTNQVTGSTGALSQFWGKLSSIGSESAHLFGEGASFVGNNLLNMGKSIANLPIAINDFATNAYTSVEQGHMQTEILQKQSTLGNQWASGQITAQEYKSGMQDLMKASTTLGAQAKSLSAKIGSDGRNVISDTINTASAVVTIMTAGMGGGAVTVGANVAEKAAADYLGSTAVSGVMNEGEAAIGKLAVDKGLFSNLTSSAQNAVKTAMTQTVLGAAKDATAAEITRAATTNLLLNYPLTYSMLSSTGQQVYQELQNAKYGSAVNTIAFNAALLLSGGPIGQALKFGGAALKGISGRIFGSTSFLDELSKLIGDQNPMGLFNSIKEDPKLVKNFSALEATNVAATKGNVMQGVYRVSDGLKAAGWDLSQMTHEDFVKQASNWATAQRMVIQDAVSRGIPQSMADRFAVGRWTALDATKVADAVTSGDKAGITQGVQDRLKAWNDFKNANPNAAFANNANLDKQITNSIKTIDNPNMLHADISAIKAGFNVRGMDSKVAKAVADMGYVAIKPASLEAPFKEGASKIATKFAGEATNEGQDFFLKTVEPLPVLKTVGDTLVNMGLSPNAASQRVYEVYQQNLAKNLSNLQISKDLATKMTEDLTAKAEQTATKKAAPVAESATSGYSKEELATMKAQGITPELLAKGKVEGGATPVHVAQESPSTPKPLPVVAKTPEEAADIISKKLANYANTVTRSSHGLPVPPITDYRQMTLNDISRALDINKSAAKEVQNAIMDSMLQVPRAIRGIGDKIMDYNYKYNPIAPSYTRIQGAGRFAWNPFFKAKLAYKSEFLSQLESSGKFPTLAGTNTVLSFIFPDKYAQLDNITKTLESKGIFGSGFTNEGADEATAGYGKLNHVLLSSQKRSISGLVSTMADRARMNPEDFVNNFPNETRDVVHMITQYNPRSNFLNSPMARTLNFAFFPFRFNIKVASIMTRAIAREPAVVQFAIIKGTMDAHKFLNSSQGMAWYSQNSDVIGLLKYFSPVETISSIASALGVKDTSVGAFGELGGLPFGFIPQLLDSEGLTHFGQSYVNPTTGAVAKNYVPIGSRAKLATAIEDFIGSLYTYPGSEIGLTSKSKVDRSIGSGLTGVNSKTDYNAVTPAITPAQQQFSQVVQGLHPPTGRAAQTTAVPTQQTNQATQVPSQKSNLETTLPKKTSTKLKKSQFKPVMLPGQTQLGSIPGVQ